VVQTLLAALRDSAPEVRSAAAKALGKGGVGDPAVVEALLAALKDSDLFVRSAAAEALGSVGTGNPAVVEALFGAMKDSDDWVRSAATETLGSVGAGNSAVVETLLAALKDSEQRVQTTALRAIARQQNLNSAQLLRVLTVVFHYIYSITFTPGDQDFYSAAQKSITALVTGRQLPGYRWRSLKARRLRRERLRKFMIGAGTGLAIGIALYFGASWFAALPEGDPKKKFLDAVPAVSVLFGLLWGLLQVIRGNKSTIWPLTRPACR
jgi:hypothetical protein